MNFNSDYQSNQNRLCDSEVVNLSLSTIKTKTKLDTGYVGYKNILRIACELVFVVVAIGLGYMQGLKSFTSYKEGAQNRSVQASAQSSEQVIEYLQKEIPENHQDLILR